MFVDMTAAWCVTCLVNERVAIGTDAVRHAFAAGDVAYLKGDWTRQDPAITAFLRQNGRDGVPLYVFYPGLAARRRMLPQILTESAVLRLLRTSWPPRRGGQVNLLFTNWRHACSLAIKPRGAAWPRR